MPTPTPRRTTCSKCGERFSIGWGLMNHQQSSPCATAVENEGVDEGPVVEGTGPPTVSMYMEALALRGTLDPHFLHKYAGWGPRPVNRVVTECSRFLRATEVGAGSSRRQAQTFLDYTKSVGGRGHILPKTVEGCWTTLEKVTFHNVFVTFYYMHCHILLHALYLIIPNASFHYPT